jgi:transposase
MRKSLNDLNAQSLGHKSCMAKYMFGYNVQAAVEDSHQIIVAAEIHDKPTDYGALPVLVNKIEEDYREKPKEILADLGYKSVTNLKLLEDKEITPYIAAKSKEHDILDEQFSEQVKPTEKKHIYTCMNEKELPVHSRRSNGRTEFIIKAGFCEGCAKKDNCKAFDKNIITLMAEEDRLIINKHIKRTRTVGFKEIYKKRKVIVEPVFGNIKNKGMKILVTGKEKVSTWWKMACTAHNIEKIIKTMALKAT